MQIIKTVSFPDERLLSDVGPLPDGLRGVVWNLRDRPQDAVYADIDAVILPYVDAYQVLDSLSLVPELKLVQTQTTGYDGVMEAAGTAAVATASGVHAAATAELAIGLILAKLRGLDVAARDQTARHWRPRRGISLADRRVLLVGTGGIGQEIARRLEPFEVTLTRVARTAREDRLGTVHGTEDLVRLAATHDVLVVITPLSKDTHDLINAAVLAALPDNSLVVNVARGAVVDSAALTKEVISGRLHCAVDVFDPEPLPQDHPLWDSHNALITPHLGGTRQRSSQESQD